MKYSDGQTEIAYTVLGPETAPTLLWAHGWGQTHAAFLPLAQSLEKMGHHVLVDFPGFGASPPPAEAWGTEDYAEALAKFITHTDKKPVILIGHSFGCRVGLQLAARYPELVSGLFLIAAAGLKPKRPLGKKLYLKTRVLTFKALKLFIPLGLNKEKLYKLFGSADYRSAGAMRGVFVRVVNEDLTATAQQVACPTTLVYGTRDTETPLEIGERLNKLVKNSELMPLQNLDHYTVLGEGRHQVAPILKRFIEKVTAA